jgi:hypothetical protein
VSQVDGLGGKQLRSRAVQCYMAYLQDKTMMGNAHSYFRILFHEENNHRRASIPNA